MLILRETKIMKIKKKKLLKVNLKKINISLFRKINYMEHVFLIFYFYY